jgi:hypothetical protein
MNYTETIDKECIIWMPTKIMGIRFMKPKAIRLKGEYRTYLTIVPINSVELLICEFSLN